MKLTETILTDGTSALVHSFSFRSIIFSMFPLEILSQEDYDKKVSRKQSWSNFWVALGEGMAAANAGYSSSTTTYNGNSNISGYASAYGFTIVHLNPLTIGLAYRL